MCVECDVRLWCVVCGAQCVVMCNAQCVERKVRVRMRCTWCAVHSIMCTSGRAHQTTRVLRAEFKIRLCDQRGSICGATQPLQQSCKAECYIHIDCSVARHHSRHTQHPGRLRGDEFVDMISLHRRPRTALPLHVYIPLLAPCRRWRWPCSVRVLSSPGLGSCRRCLVRTPLAVSVAVGAAGAAGAAFGGASAMAARR
jgi:hypothetical protein